MNRLSRTLTALAIGLTAAGLAACSSTPSASAPAQPRSSVTNSAVTGSATGPATGSGTGAATGAATAGAATGVRKPASVAGISHIHAVARDPKTGELLLATHEGLFRLVGSELRRTGPVVDLMGFAVGPDGTYYASGHPGRGVDLPQPVGLLTSTDSGLSWQVASRGGESDFHALAVGPTTVTGFDGALRTTTDRKNWTDRTITAPPRALAAAPNSGALLATTGAGLLLSADDGTSWRALSPPQLAVLVAWADERTIVIATRNGQLATSEDAGGTWTLHPKAIGPAEALYAKRGTDGKVEIVVVVAGRVLSTTDGGATTEPLAQ